MTQDFETQIKEKTDNQLSEIYLNANDYQPEFIKLVELELLNRNIPIDSLNFIKAKKEAISDETLAIGVQGNHYWIMTSFLACLFGGIVGIAAGYIYAYSKHKNANDVEFYYYNESTRKYGKWMLFVGCSILGLILLSKIVEFNY
jgi:hypothetical protein